MSDADPSLSDDDGADMFGSDSEDQGSEVGQSLDLPSLYLDSLHVKSPQTGCDTDQGGFDTASTPKDESEGEELPDREGSTAKGGDEDSDQKELDSNRFTSSKADGETQVEKHYGNEEDQDIAVDLPSTMTLCESPRSPEHNANEKHDKPSDDLNISQRTKFHRYEVDFIDANFVRQEKTQAHSENNELKSLLAESEALIEELNQETALQNEASVDPLDKISPPESLEQTDIVKASPPSKALLYTVESLFPIVYERDLPPVPTQSDIAKVVPVSSVTNGESPCQRRRIHNRGNHPDSSIVSRLAALQQQLHAARSDLMNATRTFKLQLLMAEADNKKISQRNARLKKQLSVTTTDLQRVNAEMIKLKTENELYAAKLPRLQAELLEETSQVDETQAQSLQTQLVLTQLKARSHVLQTRNLTLESHNNKLTERLRECQQQLRKKTAILEQQTEKTRKIEAELNELKTTHAQEKLEWKHRLTSALQRFEHDKVKLETHYKASERKELRELKDRAEKATKKRRTMEATAAKLEEELKHCKLELTSANNNIHRHITDLRTHESLLRKAHRTEATLRNDLAACRTKLRALQDSRRRMASHHAVQTRRHPNQIPIELFIPLDESSDEEDNQETQCNCCLSSSKTNEPQSPLVCTECPQLQDQLHQLHLELKRVRSLHVVELHAQQSVLDVLLHAKGNLQ
ncbi:hypothetical protein V7S43_016309 [Phytophthora oleae]|uniref:Uncharacterized protein n=1 Tax=Phytophthora oleae TaxID=2107226 RepID=A0ABD3EW40_9STRA